MAKQYLWELIIYKFFSVAVSTRLHIDKSACQELFTDFE